MRPTAQLGGLNPTATYAVFDRSDRELLRTTGHELMALGIPGDIHQGASYSRTLHIKRV